MATALLTFGLRAFSPRPALALAPAVAVVALFGALLITKPAAADTASPCEVRVDDAALPASWSGALGDLRSLVAKLDPTTTDCRVVTVTADAEGGTVVFTTADGRRARRHVAGPSELTPLVEALLVFRQDPQLPSADRDIAAPGPAEDEEAEPRTEARTLVALDPAPLKEGSQLGASEKRPSPGLLVGAGAGVKGSWPNDSVAAVGQIFIGVSFERWELAGFGRWELEHDAESNASDHAPSGKLRYSAIGGGAMFGRRQPIGPLVLIGGARAALFDAEEERTGQKDANRAGRRSDEFLDPRLGLYVGCILTDSSRLRVRVQIDGDAGLLVHRGEVAELPAFPRWNLGISLGAEASFLQ